MKFRIRTRTSNRRWDQRWPFVGWAVLRLSWLWHIRLRTPCSSRTPQTESQQSALEMNRWSVVVGIEKREQTHGMTGVEFWQLPVDTSGQHQLYHQHCQFKQKYILELTKYKVFNMVEKSKMKNNVENVKPFVIVAPIEFENTKNNYIQLYI